MFAKLSKDFSFFANNLPVSIRAFVSLFANIMDELYVIANLELKRGWCFWDLGAYVGAYSILASRMIGEKGVVISVEPHPDNFRALLSNIRNFRRCNIIPVNVAIWNKNERRKLYCSSGSGAFHTLRGHALVHKQPNHQEVVCITLDSLYKKMAARFMVDQITAVKIDVEGAEEEVLEGSREVLNMIKFIVIELHNPDKMKRIMTLLDKYGFYTRTIGSHHLIGVKDSGQLSNGIKVY